MIPNPTCFEEYAKYIDNWNWQWFATLTLDSNLKTTLINKLRLNWTRNLCTTENIQVAYFYVEVHESGHPHLHLLMIGSSKNNKTLLDIDPKKYESAWSHRAHIFVPDSNIAVSNYFTKNINQYGSDYDIYNKKLLAKAKLN